VSLDKGRGSEAGGLIDRLHCDGPFKVAAVLPTTESSSLPDGGDARKPEVQIVAWRMLLARIMPREEERFT